MSGSDQPSFAFREAAMQLSEKKTLPDSYDELNDLAFEGEVACLEVLCPRAWRVDFVGELRMLKV